MKKYKTLSEFLNDLSAVKRIQVETLRQIILNTDSQLEENIKWNAPNYVYKGVDRITFNLMNKEGKVKVVLHMGASKKENKDLPPILADKTNIVQWNSDIRGTITFDNISDIEAKKEDFKALLVQWLAIEV